MVLHHTFIKLSSEQVLIIENKLIIAVGKHSGLIHEVILARTTTSPPASVQDLKEGSIHKVVFFLRQGSCPKQK